MILLNEKIWFESHQALLLRIINSYEGRALLGIDQAYPVICRVESNFISGIIDRTDDTVQFQTEFRTNGKWGKVIRHRWREFEKLSKHFYDSGNLTNIYLGNKWQLAATTSTFFPNADGDAGATTFDGYAFRSLNNSTWDSIVNGVGTSSNDSTTNVIVGYRGGSNANTYVTIFRGVALFDTEILGGDIIDSTILSGEPNLLQDDNSENPNLVVTSSSPASNTAVANGDYQTMGDTFLSDEVAYSSMSLGTYVDFTLNASGLALVDGSGITKLGIRLSKDASNTAPTYVSLAETNIWFDSADTAGTTSDPKLVVVHTAVGRQRFIGQRPILTVDKQIIGNRGNPIIR